MLLDQLVLPREDQRHVGQAGLIGDQNLLDLRDSGASKAERKQQCSGGIGHPTHGAVSYSCGVASEPAQRSAHAKPACATHEERQEGVPPGGTVATMAAGA